jgi:type I restriction enzyme S subunit
LETLLGKVDVCHQRLTKIPGLFKRFRQSVLAAACSGRLTTDWREENPNVEDSASLIIKVKEQRTARHQAECLDAKKRGQQPPKLDWNDDNPDFSEYDLPDLPDTWQWSHVAKFGFVKGG